MARLAGTNQHRRQTPEVSTTGIFVATGWPVRATRRSWGCADDTPTTADDTRQEPGSAP
jgi:hypothetical protein